jgi:hypothetical protein
MKMYRMALVLGLAAFGATSLQAIESDPTGGADAVRVMNNYRDQVRVYVEDSRGHLHRLGRVARGQLKEFQIPEEVADASFRIKVYPAQPVWAFQQDDFGIKTNPLTLDGESTVTLWVEPDLTKTMVEVATS